LRVHGLQGVVLFDNGSSKYSLEEVDRTLGQVDGLEAVRVLSIPQPYGPWKGKFLPSGALNIARLRYFASAASVLVTDIDELVTPGRDGGIFEAAERSPLGYVRLRGSWRYPKRVKAGSSSRHADHVYRRIFPSHPGGTIEARKYCVCPTGPLGDRRWVLHRVILDRTDRRKIERSVETDQFEYWHCRLITTDWKYPREVPARYKLRHDPATQRVMESVFGRGTRRQRS
jgi:hypothetical protein